jgi:predicted porin
MKKTLVALAALAVSGASFAQVTMTGNFEYHFESKDTSGVQSSGFGTDTSELYFNVVEDMGGGLKTTVNMGIAGLDRSGESTSLSTTNVGATCCGRGTYGLDGSIAISSSVGSVTLKTARGADYLSGGVAGVAGYGLDGKIFDSRSIRDSISFSAPVMAGLKVGASFAEPDQTSSTATDGGEGTGSAGNTKGRKNTYSIAYAGGPLAADFAYATYDNKPANGNTDYLWDAGASYDFGIAKVGAGFENKYYVNSGNRFDTLIGVSVPVGAASINAQYANRAFRSFGTDQNASIWSLGVTYNLSKRTYAIADYAKWDGGAANVTTAAAASLGFTSVSYYRFILGHNF